MAKFTLSPQDHERVAKAVAAAEAGTDAEIVTVLAPQSDSYHDVGLHVAIAGLFLLLAAVGAFPAQFQSWAQNLLGGWDHQLSQRESMTALFASAIIVFLTLRYLLAWMPLRMVMTPKRTKERRVRRAAINLFRAVVEGRTRHHTGVLLYLSLAEHRAEIIADASITAKVAPELWGDAMAKLVHHIRKEDADEGMVQAIEAIGQILAQHVPRSDGDTNELPNRLIAL